jgi:SnoaL-like domain
MPHRRRDMGRQRLRFRPGRRTGRDRRCPESGPGHAKAHHTTNIVVSEGPGDEVRVRSKGLGLLEGGAVASVVYADELRRTDDGWRISRRVIHVK